MAERYDAIILGAGPAGLTAGIYLGRARLKPLIIDTGTVGGQMVLSYAVANYPGVEETSGHAIARTMLKQAKSFGCEVISQATVTSFDLSGEIKTFEVEDEGVFEAPTVIIASGGRPRALGLESEERFGGHGISYCATCDGDFFTDKPIVVVGGGNSALEEAVSLTKYASKVTVLHILDEFQAQPWAVEGARKNPKVELHTNQEVVRFEGGGSLERVVTRNTVTGEVTTIEAQGTFVFIGYEPNTEAFKGVIGMNQRGEIIADEAMQTDVAGVFVAGDSRVKRYRQITTAVSDGTIAALSAIEHIGELRRPRQTPTAEPRGIAA
jgi:thioredoxin reductase (NADPH)